MASKLRKRIASWANADKETKLAYLLGTGLVLMAMHNRSLGAWALVPPVGGFACIVLAVYKLSNGLDFKHLDYGPKWLYIPMLLILLQVSITSIYLAVTGEITGGRVVALIAFYIVLFLVYVVCRNTGPKVFKPFTVAIVIEAASLIIIGSIYQVKTGGLLDFHWIDGRGNYDMAAGLLIFGFVVSHMNNRWWLQCLCLVGLFFTGAVEGIVVSVVLLLFWSLMSVIKWRRVKVSRILVPIGALILVLGICTPLGVTYKIYQDVPMITTAASEVIQDKDYETTDAIGGYYNVTEMKPLDIATGYRAYRYIKAVNNITFMGHGPLVTEFYADIPHNVPLEIAYDVGPLAAVSWLFIMLMLFIKTPYKFLIITVVALGMLDHYISTQVAPWWWAVAGVATNEVAI